MHMRPYRYLFIYVRMSFLSLLYSSCWFFRVFDCLGYCCDCLRFDSFLRCLLHECDFLTCEPEHILDFSEPLGASDWFLGNDGD